MSLQYGSVKIPPPTATPLKRGQQLNTITSQEVVNELEKKLLIFYANFLGMVAEDQSQFDVAINYYKKAWEMYEKFCDWYWASQTLGKWGRVLEAQENYAQALPIYIRALAIEQEHNQDLICYYINALARMLKQLGESQFQVIWRDATGEECAGEVREVIWTARDELG
ncbi:hypothetical protein A6S26_02405 [Nostoc sp. ATCC 43529]|nr:hypothetical protein A6S26_02405 [Nostoc sp. ATCC 43529]